MAKKKGSFAKHTSRVGSRVGERAKNFVVRARAGLYDQTDLAKDIGASVMDVTEFWGGLFGMRGSPAAPLLDLGTQPALTWQAPGITRTVVVEDPVPDDAVFTALQLRHLKGGPAGNVNMITTTVDDEERLQLTVQFRDPGGPPTGDYYGTLTYTSASEPNPVGGPWFACFVKGTVTP